MNRITTPAHEPALVEAAPHLRPGVHLLADDRALAVYDELGHGRELARLCPHGAHDLASIGMVNVTAELMCASTGERWSIKSL